MFIQIYNSLIRILYPLVIKRYINKRKENGKEDVARFHAWYWLLTRMQTVSVYM